MKICSKCKQEKELSEFSKDSSKIDNLDPCCKICKRIKAKYYYNTDKQKHAERTSIYIKNNKEKHKKLVNKWYKENKENFKPKYKQYYQQNKEKIIKQSLLYQNSNKEKYDQYQKEWRLKNKDKLNNQIKEWSKKERKNNPLFKLRHSLRARIYDILKNNRSKSKLIKELLGCTIEEYKQYLETQFKPEMNWDNHGKIWEIDHIVGCINFDLSDFEQQKQCFHYTNTRPLFKTTKIAESFGYNETGNKNRPKYE